MAKLLRTGGATLCPPLPGRPAMMTTLSTASTLPQCWTSLTLLQGQVEAYAERVLRRQHGLALREYLALAALAHEQSEGGGYLQVGQIAASVGLSQSATSRLVTRMESRGVISRSSHSHDRRNVYLRATEQGLRRLERARPAYADALQEAVSAAAQDPVLLPLVKILEGASEMAAA
ncbi:MarR family winged helix-turn-helix transcriptional regulator [Streptomyces mirabilis]